MPNRQRNTTVTLLVDLSAVEQGFPSIPDLLACINSKLRGIAEGRFCVPPPGQETPAGAETADWYFVPAADAIQVCNRAVEAAADRRQPLVVIRSPLSVSAETVASLLEALSADPMFGFAVARVADPDGRILKLDESLGDSSIANLPEAALRTLPDLYIVPELVGSCAAIRSEVISNFGLLDELFGTSAGAWLHYLCRARRAGFRGVIANRAVAAGLCKGLRTLSRVAPADFWDLHHQYPDVEWPGKSSGGCMRTSMKSWSPTQARMTITHC